MRIISTAILLVFLALSPVFAQVRLPFPESNSKESYPIDGTHLLDKQEEMVRQYIQQHPDALEKMRLSKTAGLPYTVGSKKAWWTQSFLSGGSFYQVNSTCQKVGTYCYVFVEDALWGNRVTQAAVDSMALYFDRKTPANPNKGIYQSDVDAFGTPPDVDGDPRIVILIEDIKDGYSGTGGYIAGYFTGTNEIPGDYSNAAEIYYLDGNPGLGKNTDGTISVNSLLQAISTTAHEFQHMIFWNAEKNKPRSRQLTFINEGCSMMAEINAGFAARGQSGQYGYNSETNYYLLGWRNLGDDKTLIDYSRASRFFLYLRDQFGMDIFKKIINSDQWGTACLNDAFAQMGSSLKLGDVYTKFMMANITDDKSVDPAYGYVYTGLPKPTGNLYTDPNTSSGGSLNNLAGEYLTFNNGSNLNVKFSSDGNLIIKALESGPSVKRVRDVTLGSTFNEPEFGKGIKTVTFAVINPSEFNSGVNYSFTSSASVASVTELKWDEAEPTDAYKFDPGDTVCVTFDAVKGGRLDSVKVALERAGSIKGGIWEFTGNPRPTPLGRKLAFPITASSNLTPGTPYPVPFPNWRTIDLRSYNISTDKPFAVGFIFGEDAVTPGIMVTDHSGGDPYHSFTSFTPTGHPRDWYYLSSGTNTIAIYLIRAYITLLSTQTVVSGTPVPASYSLSQNYPNPFNPVTTIRYEIPEEGFVTLKVYDMLGKEVASLVEKDLQAGEYTASFDGKNLSSGIYFYKLTQGNFTQTKKLMLMK